VFILNLSFSVSHSCRSVVQQHISSPVYFRCIPTISITPTMCSTKVPNERTDKMNSGLISTRHQVDPKKELSRILRTDAAVKGIERKANSEKYLTLWPKAVLEALDEAIKENRWQSALKVQLFNPSSFLQILGHRFDRIHFPVSLLYRFSIFLGSSIGMNQDAKLIQSCLKCLGIVNSLIKPACFSKLCYLKD